MNTLPYYLTKFTQRTQLKPAVKYKVNDSWTSISWTQYFNTIKQVAESLVSLGAKKNSKIAIVSNTRYEWGILDLAILGLGAQTVPIYQNATNEDIHSILKNSEAEIIFVESVSYLRNIVSIITSHKIVKKIVCLEDYNSKDELILNWKDFLKLDKKLDFDFSRSCLDIKPEDVATIVYTSGTTGEPKGAVLTHAAIFSEVSESFPLCGVTPEDTSLSFLPYAHILGRIELWGHAFIGFTLCYADGIEKVKNNLTEINPTILVAVPRIFEKIYLTIQSQLDGNILERKMVKWSLEIGHKVGELKLRRSPVPLSLAIEYELARKFVLSKVKQAFGGKLKFAISGGAPLSREIALFFHACDILILEGYGLTETTAAITVNRPFDYKFGSVGKPIGEVELKIAEDGEILIKSKKLMSGYYRNPEETQKVLIDGWFHTGDIGEIQNSGDLKITDRKKDLIKTAGGKYVAPQKIENLLKIYPFLSHVLIHGDQKKFIVALITLDKAYILNYAKQNNIEYKDYESLTQHQNILNLVRQAVAETNSKLASFESIKRYKVLTREFSIESGEITPSLKVKRKLLDKKFSDIIEKLYL